MKNKANTDQSGPIQEKSVLALFSVVAQFFFFIGPVCHLIDYWSSTSSRCNIYIISQALRLWAQPSMLLSNVMKQLYEITVSHFSYAPLFQGPHFFLQKCWNRTFSICLMTSKKYLNHSCESLWYVKGNLTKNARAARTSIFSICILR